MYYTFITYAAYFVAILFLILLYRTFSNVTLPQLWQLAKQKVKTALRIKSEIEKAEAKGEKPFYFKNGTVVIYAKTQPMAIFKYRKIKEKEKAEKLLSEQKIKPKNHFRMIDKLRKKAV